MRDSILRVIDDLETKQKELWKHTISAGSATTNAFFDGHVTALKYTIRELRKVLDDHAKL